MCCEASDCGEKGLGGEIDTENWLSMKISVGCTYLEVSKSTHVRSRVVALGVLKEIHNTAGRFSWGEHLVRARTRQFLLFRS